MDAAVFSFEPAIAERLTDIAAIFGDCSYGRKCWCAYWYLLNRDYKAGWGQGNKAHFEALVLAGKEPGIIAYAGDEPAGWLGIAPRTVFDRLNRSKPLAPVDDLEVWAMNCFIVRKPWRRSGLMRRLIRAGVEFVRQRGGRIVEAYPFDGTRKPLGDELFIGTAAAFADCGFVEVARRLPARPVMRLELR
jgi:GNAT superfamily N-acetyltransferase